MKQSDGIKVFPLENSFGNCVQRRLGETWNEGRQLRTIPMEKIGWVLAMSWGRRGEFDNILGLAEFLQLSSVDVRSLLTGR